MLSPPPRLQSQAATNECGNILVDRGIPSFSTPDGEYKGKDCVYVALPMPHAADLTGQPINPLAADSLAPSAYTPGVRLSRVIWDSRAEGRNSSRKKPKTSLFRNKSTFMSRTTAYDRFSRFLKAEGPSAALWVSVGRSIQLLPCGPVKSDTLLRVLFTHAWPLCHIAGPGLEVVCGMSSGDIVWIDAVSGKYTRINKSGNLSRAPVTAIKWYGVNSLQVVAGHADGSVVIYDLDREDGRDMVSVGSAGRALVQPFSGSTPGTNPLRAFKLSNIAITELLVVDGNVLSTSSDGYLRILNVDSGAVQGVLEANFGGLLAAAVSPDHRFLVFGGEEDVIYLYDYTKLQVLARFMGHRSWVRRIEFDISNDPTVYRFVSVAEDAQMLMWEFSPESLSARTRVAHMVPIGEVRPLLPDILQVPLTDVVLDPRSISVVGSDSRIWTFLRPEKPGNHGSSSKSS